MGERVLALQPGVPHPIARVLEAINLCLRLPRVGGADAGEGISDRHRYLVDVREGPRVVLVAERHAPAEATFTFDEITALPPRMRAETQTIYFDKIMFWNADPAGHPDWSVPLPPG